MDCSERIIAIKAVAGLPEKPDTLDETYIHREMRLYVDCHPCPQFCRSRGSLLMGRSMKPRRQYSANIAMKLESYNPIPRRLAEKRG